jgi:hypothetical protein
MALVKAAAPWKIPSGIAGKIGDVPFNIESCLECVTRCILSSLSLFPGTRFVPFSLIFAPGINRIMNLRIREDVTNAMSLRTEIRPADIQLIYDVQLPADQPRAARVLFFMEKLAREQVFKPILDMLGKLAARRAMDPEPMRHVVILR